MVLGLLLFVALGGVGFLLDQFLHHVPAYQRQIEQLTAQVQQLEARVMRLEGAVDELHPENDRYTTLNEELNATVVHLSKFKRAVSTAEWTIEPVQCRTGTTDYCIGQPNGRVCVAQ
jgi:prefoldin subunit 5